MKDRRQGVLMCISIAYEIHCATSHSFTLTVNYDSYIYVIRATIQLRFAVVLVGNYESVTERGTLKSGCFQSYIKSFQEASN